MELIDYLRLLARQWRWVYGLTVLGLLLGFLWGVLLPATYTGRAELFVGSVNSGSTGVGAVSQSAAQFTLDRMPSYAGLIDSPSVTGAVRQELGLTLTDEGVAGRLDATVPPRTVLVSVTATSTNADLAARMANAAVAALGRTITEIERGTGDAQSAVDVTITRPAGKPQTPTSPNRRLGLGLGLVMGLGAGLLTSAVRDALRSGQVGDGAVRAEAQEPAAAEPAPAAANEEQLVPDRTRSTD